MNPNERIEELESQVKELSGLVQKLLTERDVEAPDAANGVAEEAGGIRRDAGKVRQAIKRDLRRNMDKVLGGEAGDSIETRIGGIWLSRLAVVSIMTALVILARLTVYSEELGPVWKVAIAYGAALLGIGYGTAKWNSRDFFPQTLLGAGLAGLYFATYAAFFMEEMRVFGDTRLAVPLLFLCLALLIGVSHMRRSQTVAGISLFLVYYTVVASCMGGRGAEHIVYALATCAVLAVVALTFHAMHQWLLFTWVAMLATHGTYILYFFRKPAGLQLSDLEYFWISNGFLALCYVVFSCACVMDARRTGEYRRTVAPMAGVNSFIFIALSWTAVRRHYPEEEWLFRLGFAGCLLVFALFAETWGPKRNYLFQIFIAKAVIMFTLALQAYLAGEKLMVAISIECLALAFSYKRSGVVIFKVLGLVLLLISFVGCLVHVKTLGAVAIAGIPVRANWFCGVGSTVAFVATSWFYARFVRRVKPEHRVVSGQWFLADTFLDAGSATAAMLYAAAGSLTMLALTILDLGTRPHLPFLLAAEGVLMAAAGFAMRAPQVEVGGVLLLVAGHACYHFLLMLGPPGFEQQFAYAPYTIVFALVTFAGAYQWERYLRRVQGGRPWEHDAIASLPYLAATFLLMTLIARTLPPLHVPVAQNGLGVVLLLAGALLRLTGVKASGILAFAIGTAAFYEGVLDPRDSFAQQPYFMVYFLLILIAYLMGERLFVVLQHQERGISKVENALRTALIGVGMLIGAFGFTFYSSANHLTLHRLALALVGLAFGVAFRESRYRWAALTMLGAATIRAFSVDLRSPQFWQFLSFAGLGAAYLIVSWAYSQDRQRTLKRADARAREKDATNG